jgi:hypothetical protein
LSNSKPWESLPFRAKYKREHPWCELAQLFPRDGNMARLPTFTGGTWISANHSTATDAHHLASCVLGTPRWDIPTNLISACRPAHEWAERYAADGLALCLFVKLKSGDLNVAELSRITHTNFPGYFEGIASRLEFEISVKPYEEVRDWMVAHAA